MNHNCNDLLDPTFEFLQIGSWTFQIYVCYACKKHFIVIDRIKSAKREILEILLDENNKWYLKIKEEVINTDSQIKNIVNNISLCQWLSIEIVR